MKITIRVEITTDWNETETFEISEIERQYCKLDQSKIGLSLAEGKDVLHKPQPIFVAAQAEARPARCIARGVREGRCRIGGAFMAANEWRRTAAYFVGGQIEPPTTDHERLRLIQDFAKN